MERRRMVLALAAAVAAALVLAGCGGDEGDALEDAAGVDTGDVAGAVADARDAAENALEVGLGDLGGFGQFGSVSVTSLGENASRVVLELFDGPGRDQYAAIQRGSCDDLGEVVVELSEVERGRSATRVERSLDRLTDGDFSVVVRRAADRDSAAAVCGELDERRALGSDAATQALSEIEALAARACSGVPAAELQRALGWTPGEVRRVAEELTRNLEVDDRDALIDACIDELEG
jgi:hypothetical protein